MKPLSIAIVEDQAALLQNLKKNLSENTDINILFSAGNGQIFLETIRIYPADKRPQVVLMDIEMPEMDGIEAVRQAKSLYPDLQFVMLTVFDDDDKIFRAIQAGASGYLLKDEPVATIVAALHDAADHTGAPMSPAIARRVLRLMVQGPPPAAIPTDPLTVLSDREREILALLADGCDNREIAGQLFLSPHTVRKHIVHIYDKLQVHNRAEAVRKALGK
jgi:DNA-binding NarL/FixJ family response regulator